MASLLNLIAEVLEARTGTPGQDPSLVPLEETPDPLMTHVSDGDLLEFVGDWPYPPLVTGEEPETTLRVALGDGHLVVHHPLQGTFRLYLQPDGSFHMEDALETLVPVRNPDGSLAGLVEEGHGESG